MPTPLQFKAPFKFDCYYHLLFRSIDGLLLFTDQRQHNYFLEKFNRFTKDIFNCWAYSLLDNHVHFIIKVKPAELIRDNILQLVAEQRTQSMLRFLVRPDEAISLFDEVAERQINRFMVSYVNTYNNSFDRKGGLFQQPFRRIEIADEKHLQQAVIYVHANAQKHKLTNDFKKHLYNSYHEILLGKLSSIDCKAVLDFFGGKENFINLHEQQVSYFYTDQWPSSKLEID